MQNVCDCIPSCSFIEYDKIDTSYSAQWTYFKMNNFIKNEYVF